MDRFREAKAVRRRIIETLYDRYMNDPLEMLVPDDFLSAGIERRALVQNIHYLADRRLVELMVGYNPPMFSAARITADGIDLVENRFEFDRRFPPAPGGASGATADLPTLVEQLVDQAEFAPLDGEARQALLRDVQFIRDEIARAPHRWRRDVLRTVLGWCAANFEDPGEHLPGLEPLRQAVENTPD